jgi:hypothetical protein
MECGDLSPLSGEGFSLHNLVVGQDRNGVPVGVGPNPAIHAMQGRFPRSAFPTLDKPCFLTGHDKRAPPRVHRTPSKASLLVGAIHELRLPTWRFALTNVFWGRFMNRPYHDWRDLFVRSASQFWMIHPNSPGRTSVPLRPLGGTCLSGPPFNVGSSIAFFRGLKSRAPYGVRRFIAAFW